MDISFEELKEKEVINILTGKKLGHIIDFIFNLSNKRLVGLILPGDRKFFKKSEDIFVSIGQIQRIGDDVILIAINDNKQLFGSQLGRQKTSQTIYCNQPQVQFENKNIKYQKGKSFVRFKRINNNKYK